jgi:hypothetical protein
MCDELELILKDIMECPENKFHELSIAIFLLTKFFIRPFSVLEILHESVQVDKTEKIVHINGVKNKNNEFYNLKAEKCDEVVMEALLNLKNKRMLEKKNNGKSKYLIDIGGSDNGVSYRDGIVDNLIRELISTKLNSNSFSCLNDLNQTVFRKLSNRYLFYKLNNSVLPTCKDNLDIQNIVKPFFEEIFFKTTCRLESY